MMARCIVCKDVFNPEQNKYSPRTCGKHTISKVTDPLKKRILMQQHRVAEKLTGIKFMYNIRKYYQDPIYQLQQCYWIDAK